MEKCCKESTYIPKIKNFGPKTVMQLEKYNNNLFEDLAREKKAIKNWQRIKILIAILKLCGNKMDLSMDLSMEKEIPKQF